jgi:ketosteroid isomerase-like protein
MVRQSISNCRLALTAVVLGVTCSAACGMSLAGVLPHHTTKKTATRQTVEALEEQWRQAQLAGDAAAMDRLLSDDYVGINASGVVTTKTQQLARIKNRVAVLTQLDLSDIKVKLIHDLVAVVTSRAEVAGSNENGPIKGSFRYTRVYQRSPAGAWKITSFEATRLPAEGVGKERADANSSQPPRTEKN